MTSLSHAPRRGGSAFARLAFTVAIPYNELMGPRSVLASLTVAAWSAAMSGCASPPPPREARLHLGAQLEGDDATLAAPPPAGRTQEDRTRALALVAEGLHKRDTGNLPAAHAAFEEALRLDASLASAHTEWAVTAEASGADLERRDRTPPDRRVGD